MVAYKRDEIVSTTELARNVSASLSSIVKGKKEKIAISKNNRLEAVLINIEEYEKLKEAFDILEHLEIAKTIKDREDSKTISFDELLKRENISHDEL